MRIAICMICDEGFEYANFGEGQHTMEGDCVGVCPTCRKHAEIGKRVEGMKPAKAFYSDPSDWDKGFLIGYRDCLLEAKGEKP